MRGGERRWSLVVVVAALMALATSPAFAQSQAINGTIEGTVKDVSGGLMPGVTVTILNMDTGAERVVVTNAQGLYRAPLLPLGSYRITAELQGFKKYEQSGISLSAGDTKVLNLALEVGAMTETVSVVADSAVVDLGKIDVGRNLNEREIKNLPLVSRNPYNFALLEPGVTGFENEEFGVPRFSVNGQMTRINYQVDGNTNTQKDRAGLRLLPMSEVMIQEVQVVSSGYAPEFGQTTGMVYNAVTPSGTNRLRGDVGYRFRTKDFSACPFYSTCTPATKPDNSLSVFTATAGGPVFRNRLFHYFGTERTYQDLPRPITMTPALVAQVGVTAQPATVQSYRSVFFFIGKGDYQINGANRLSVRTNTFRNDNPYQNHGATTAIERGNDFADHMYSAATQLVSTLGSGRLNELRIQFAKRHTRQFSHDLSSLPISVNINGGAGQTINFGRYTGEGMDFQQSIAQVIDNFTWLKGRHSYKTGFDIQWISDHRAVPLPATYTFPTVQAYLSAQSGANPRGYTTFAQTIGNPIFEMKNSLLSAFVQDDWKATGDLKILFGARYDYYMYPAGIDGAPYNSTFNRDKNNISPRGGFAWTMGADKKSVLRGSTGVMYDQPLLAIIENAYANSGLAQRSQSVSLNPGSPNAPNFPNTLAGLPPGTVQVSSTVQGMAPDFVNARTWQNSLTYERELWRDFSASIGYRYTRGWDLPVINDINLAGITPVRLLEDGRGVYSAAVNAGTRVDPRYNRIRLVESVGESWYQGMTAQVTKRFSRGVQFNFNYTLGKGEDTAPLGGNTLAVQGDAARSDPQNLNRDKGPNQLDIRHTVNGSLVAISSVKRFNSVVNAILTNNQVSILMQLASGIPDSVASNTDLNLDGNGGDRPLFVERNSMYVPSRYNVDLRYSRFFKIHGTRRIEVQGEFKNIFNVPQASGVNNTLPVNANGFPVDPAGVQLPLSVISLNGDDYEPTGGREQRKFQLGFKFYF
jgi:hypothetical protein